MEHQKYMSRCFALARKGLGSTYPNPLVGSVIVHENTIIGEGWHQKAGEPHAEVNAIAGVKDKSLLQSSTLYVNLEPCNHYGKTPPCSDLIVKHKIPRVVIGCVDSFKEVNGSGIEKLRSNGVEVIVGVLEKESRALNKRFFTFHQKKRPYIILKWAQSQDGFLAPLPESRDEQAPVFLSSRKAQIQVHQWRAEEQAILVGAQTVIDDNPALTTRWVAGKNPIPIILDPKNRIPITAKVLQSANDYLHLTKKIVNIDPQASPEEILLNSIQHLYNQNIQSVIVEGGAKTLTHFITHELWDEARIFTAKKDLHNGVKSPEIEGDIQRIFSDTSEDYQLIKKRRKQG